MIKWADLLFPPINLWNCPKQNVEADVKFSLNHPSTKKENVADKIKTLTKDR